MTRRAQRVPEDEILETTEYTELSECERMMIQEAYNEALDQKDNYND
jgi:hypothetical protein